MNYMKMTVIDIGSYTAAKKAQAYLASLRIKTVIVKTGRSPSGCTFGLKTGGDAYEICGLLRKAGINCRFDPGKRGSGMR